MRGFARDFPTTKKPGLLLMGDPGTGKTHLAVAAFRALLAKGFEGLFFDYQNLLDRIRSGYDARLAIRATKKPIGWRWIRKSCCWTIWARIA